MSIKVTGLTYVYMKGTPYEKKSVGQYKFEHRNRGICRDLSDTQARANPHLSSILTAF